jgi:hypothetical protein
MALIFRQFRIIEPFPEEVRQFGGDTVKVRLGLGKLLI